MHKDSRRNVPEPDRPQKPNWREWLPLGALVLSGWSSFFALPFVTGSNTGRVVAMLLCAALWLGLLATGLVPAASRPLRELDLALVALGGIVLVSSVFSPYAQRALTWGSLGFFGAPVWIALIVITAASSRLSFHRRERWWIAASLSWLVISLVLVFQEVASGEPASGGFNTGNHLAAILVPGIPMVLWLASAAVSRYEAVIWYAIVAFAGAAIVASNSAAGLLGLGVAVLTAAFISPVLLGARTRTAATWLRASLSGVAALVALSLVVSLAAPSILPDPLQSYVEDEVLGVTFDTRVEMWKAAFEVIQEKPLFGTGPDSFHLAAQPHLSERLYSLEPVAGVLSAPPDPHSLPMLIGVSFGLAGVVVFGAAAIVWLRSVFAARENEGADRRLLRMAAAGGALGFFTVLLFVPWAAILGGFPVVCVGLAAARPPDRTHARLSWGWRAVASVVAFTLVVLAGSLVVGLARIDRGINSPSASQAVTAYEDAADFIPTQPYPRFMALHAAGQQLGPSPDLLAAWQREVIADEQLHEDATYSLMLARDSLDQAYRWGRSELSWEEQFIARAAARFPAAPDSTLERAHLAVLQGDTEGTRRLLEGAPSDSFGSRASLYRYYLAVVEGNGGEVERLRGILEAEYGPLELLAPQ